ncbi:hypothetical protein [Candidatus Nesciobacter abundans]|uniref:TGS domain-containing protein n=1 Tax=Candidatus Nesciobacter abundans TaxID=2601668 RepID=A0A5C0UIG9_9PROT|nr:hypothetical protein [Candidatus Nesciobacter abundans]QEK39212.1 hypothetical protein FZC36_02125 [Candidatus Nesciobacter abundans]
MVKINLLSGQKIIGRSIKCFELVKELCLSSDILGFVSCSEGDKKVYDLHSEIPEGEEVKPIRRTDKEALHMLRHDIAHVLAQALSDLFDGVQYGKQYFDEESIFGFDFISEKKVSESDFPAIEFRMSQIIERKDSILREIWSKSKSLREFKNDSFKVDIVKNCKKESLMLYSHGGYIDICGGPRTTNNDFLGHNFEILGIGESSWLYDGSIKMQRIYGTYWPTEADLKNYLSQKKQGI